MLDEQIPSRKAFDPGPLPTAALRMFAPAAAGDARTSAAYLSTCFIRLQSAFHQGEPFTLHDVQAIRQAFAELREVMAEIDVHLATYLESNPVQSPR